MGGRHEGTGESRLRAPAAHRGVAGLASPVVGYFVARLLVRLVPSLPPALTYAVCLAVALALGWRAWSARIDLGARSLRVHNTLATTTVDRREVRRVSANGRLEWRRGGGRPVRLPSEALRGAWWTFGTGRRTYAFNRERLESWARLTARLEHHTGHHTGLDTGLDTDLDTEPA